jgi:hypothetical protein
MWLGGQEADAHHILVSIRWAEMLQEVAGHVVEVDACSFRTWRFAFRRRGLAPSQIPPHSHEVSLMYLISIIMFATWSAIVYY